MEEWRERGKEAEREGGRGTEGEIAESKDRFSLSTDGQVVCSVLVSGAHV